MTTITCGDLARLGGPWSALLDHDPDHQTAGAPHCHCWREPRPEDWCGGETSPPDLPSYLIEQHCDRVTEARPLGGYLYTVRLCCVCVDSFRQVRQPRDVSYWPWLADQCAEALALRDELDARRTDSSPAGADMDCEAGLLEEWSDED